MSTLASDIINAALRKLGVIAAGESATAAESADGLADLNAMIDSFNSDRLFIYSMNADVYTFVPNQQKYTIGAAQNFNGARPQEIVAANVINVANASYPVRTPVTVYDDTTFDNWAAISVLNVPTPTPTALYYDGGFPTASISFWGVPNIANQIELWNWAPLASLATLSTAVTLPPGYLELVTYSLAIRIAPDYGKEASSTIIQMAADARRRVESSNSPTPASSCDSALLNLGSPGQYNWLTNSSR